ncbi:MAG: molybdopterin-dependent oxidoreductase [Acidobacteria bacterium]|nr:molybdopterin-dependent oxidoreductase [Acidobacteriota bacterium]
MTMTRRNWLSLTSRAGAGILTAGTAGSAWGQIFRPADVAPPVVQTLATACALCDSACGVTATVQDGVLTFLEGLAGDTQGGGGRLCGKGAAGAAFLYDPNRLKYPMKRTNPNKGLDEDPGWVRITWQEALDTIAERFRSYIDQYGPESLLFVSRPNPDVFTRLLNALGAINRVDHIDECYTADKVIQKYTTGSKSFCNDFENSRYMLLFGWDLVAKSKLVFTRGVQQARDNGAKVVCFNPVYSATARWADEWYPIRPGADLAVALAMIQVILAENLYNLEFVDNYTNFSLYEKETRAHFQSYTLEWAQELSDVPAGDIRRIAREFSSQGPAIAPAHKKTLCANYTNGTQLCHAISILNIFAGTIDRPGGRYFPRSWEIPGVDAIYKPAAYPAKKGRRIDGRDKLPFADEAGNGNFSTLADGMLNQYPGMIKAAFINFYTILGFPRPLRIAEALNTVEFTVVMDVLPTDTAQLADIVLPHITYLEANDIVTREYSAIVPQVLPRRAVVPAMFEAKSIGYVSLELGKRLAPDYFRKPNGDFINPTELLDEKAKAAGLGANFAEFRDKGLLTREEAFVPRTTFAAPGGKCQIYVPQFAARNLDPLPVWKQKREIPTPEYPFYYLTYIPAVHRRNTTQNNPILHEMMPENAAILNPLAAARLGIKEGQPVQVRSRVGSIVLNAHLSETLRPDCVLVAHGFGHQSAALKLASGRGARDGDIIPDQTADDMVREGNFGASAGIMDAVVTVEPG